MASKCSPPKSQTVKAHTRGRPIHRKKRAQAARKRLPYVVRNESGQVVSYHRTYTAAIRQRARLDRKAFRAGRGRPYHAGKA